jgi:flagellar basal body-associated protein FliL
MKPEKKVKNVKENNKKIPTKKGSSTLIIGIVAVILFAGIAYAVLSGDSTSKKTGNEMKLPSYAYTNPLTLKAYKYATEHPEILEQIP